MATSSDAIKAGKAFVEISADDKPFNKTIDRVAKKFFTLGSVLTDVGKKFAVTGVAILAPFGGAFLAAVRHADAIQDVADRMETTTEAVSRLGYAADFSASKLEDVEAASKLLTKAAIAASKGGKDEIAAFDKLGRSAEEFLALDADERFVLIAEALEGIEDPLERSNFLFTLLGKSATTVLPLLANGSEGLRKLFEEAEKTGSVVRGEDAARAAKVADLIDKAWKEVKNTVFEVGLTFLAFTDDLTESSNSFSNMLANLRKWIQENRKLIATILVIGAALTATGLILVGLGLSLKVIATGITLITTLWKALTVVAAIGWAVLTSPVVGFLGAIAVIVMIIGGLTGKLGSFFSGVGDTFKKVGETFGLMWKGILAALKKGDFQALWKIVQFGMYAIFLDVVALLRSKWNDFANFFRDAFRDAAIAVQTVMLNLARFIQRTFIDAILTIVNFVNQAYRAITGGGQGKMVFPTPERTKEIEKEVSTLEQGIKSGAKRETKLLEQAKTAETAKELKDIQEEIQNVIDSRKMAQAKLNELMSELKGKVVEPEVKPLIDTKALEAASKDVDKEFDRRIDSIKEIDRRERELRDKAQEDRIKGIKDEADAYRKMVKDLTDELNKVPPPGLPVAPMPHVKGKSPEQELGDAVKGLFNSADFKGTLGLGPASTIADQQLSTQKDLLGELRALHTTVRGNPGLTWG